MALTDKEITFLRNRNLGGENNAKGNRYEDFFAVKKIVVLGADTSVDPESTFLSSQAEERFVDDLEIIFQERLELFQLKDTQKLSWGKFELETLQYGFRRQEQLLTDEPTPFELFLVNSKEDLVSELRAGMPTELVSSQVIYFQAYETIRQFIQDSEVFHDALIQLCALDKPSFDKLESLAAHVLGTWCGSEKKHLSLASVFSRLEGVSLSFIRSDHIVEMNDEAKRILSAVPGFRFEVSNGYLEWGFGSNDAGTFQFPTGSEEFRILEEALVRSKPKNFSELEPMLIP